MTPEIQTAGLSGGEVGPKKPVTGKTAVASSQHAIVTETMLDIMREGGNAVDAAIAGCIVQATVQQEMTNHTGTVQFLFYEAKTGHVHELNSTGTIVAGVAPFRRVPTGRGLYAQGHSPFAVIPGFMPGMKAMFEKFGSLSWQRLVEPAVEWAEKGHVVGSFEHLVIAQTVDFFLYTPSGREHFTPNGHLPQVGERWPKPALAANLRKLASEGPDHFITGEWAEHFVSRANELGWGIKLEHMSQDPPRWASGTRYRHGDHEIVQLSPPERQAVYCSIVLGILEEVGVKSMGHYADSAEAVYYLAHALRRAEFETGLVNDPRVFETPTETLMSRDFHQTLGRLLKLSKPRVDLTKHWEVDGGPATLAAAGIKPAQPSGSCESSIVDRDGNWVQMMNTLQSGGISGEVVDGVPMVGSHGRTSLGAPMSGWFTGGGRMRSVIGSTIVFKDGKPWWSMGSPGNVYCTVPQVLSNVLDFGMDPYAGEEAPRILPLSDEYKLSAESRLEPNVVQDLLKMGILVDPLPAYDYHMGSYQMSWRDDGGTLHAVAGPRRAGVAGAF
ncbi:MAG: gamma-glutamyltransferase [Candidatus Dormibacteria bacterium]